MRKLGKKNKKLFIMLSIITICVVIIFVYFILFMANKSRKSYVVNSGSYLYDNDYNLITVEQTSKIKKKIDNYYYLIENNNNYKIGKHAIINSDSSKIYLYGTVYQIFKDGSVEKFVDETEVLKTSPTKFFKIDDRKYLFIDSKIKSKDNSINTSGYLIIELDKKGNATLANNEINVKTINPIILSGTTFDFDIANEKLLYEKNTIDLKNIIGSTNSYKNNTEKDNTNKEEDTDNTTNNNYYEEYLKNVVNSYNNLYNSVNDMSGQISQTITKDGTYYELNKWSVLKSVISGTTYIDLNYAVYDPSNEYQTVFVYITDDQEYERKIELNKQNTAYTILGLNINTKYYIKFGYRIVGENSDIYNDEVSVITKIPEFKLNITKLTQNKIYFNIKIDKNYKIESGLITLYYNNGTKLDSTSINITDSITSNGQNGYFDITGLSWSDIELKLENLCYSSNYGVCLNYIDLNVSSKIKNE